MRSFFVGRVEQSDVDAVLERLGGPKLKVGNVYQCMRIYIYIYRDVCTNLNNLEHQFSMHAGKSIEGSVTLSWGRHGGLGESPGSRTWVGHGAFSQSRIPEPAQSTGLSMFLNVVQKKP